jgi:hypothetical protein
MFTRLEKKSNSLYKSRSHLYPLFEFTYSINSIFTDNRIHLEKKPIPVDDHNQLISCNTRDMGTQCVINNTRDIGVQCKTIKYSQDVGIQCDIKLSQSNIDWIIIPSEN